MKTLVFGATGQIGLELRRYGNVVALDRRDGDLCDPRACARAIFGARPDAVINAAAITDVTGAERDCETAMRVNGHAPGAMAQAAADLEIPFLHISTDYVFNGSGHAPWTPDAAPAPLNVYGRTKLHGENAVRAAGGNHAILRTSWVFSPHGRNFVSTMLRLGRTERRLKIVADQVGGPTLASDIARALMIMAAALQRTPQKTGTYHLSGVPEVTWAGFAREIFRRAGMGVEIEEIASTALSGQPRRPANSRLDCTSLFWKFGIAQPDWRQALDGVLLEPAAA